MALSTRGSTLPMGLPTLAIRTGLPILGSALPMGLSTLGSLLFTSMGLLGLEIFSLITPKSMSHSWKGGRRNWEQQVLVV